MAPSGPVELGTFLRAWNACGVRTAATFDDSLGSLSRPRASTPRRRPAYGTDANRDR